MTKIIYPPRVLIATAIEHRRVPLEMKTPPGYKGPYFQLFGPCPASWPMVGRPGDPEPEFGTGLVPKLDLIPVDAQLNPDNTVDVTCRWCHKLTWVTDGDLVDWLNNSGIWFNPGIQPAPEKEHA